MVPIKKALSLLFLDGDIDDNDKENDDYYDVGADNDADDV